MIIEESENLTVRERSQLEALVDRYSGSAPFRPLDMFSVNFASAASIFGLGATYIIVLLQFKVGDPGIVDKTGGE